MRHTDDLPGTALCSRLQAGAQPSFLPLIEHPVMRVEVIASRAEPPAAAADKPAFRLIGAVLQKVTFGNSALSRVMPITTDRGCPLDPGQPSAPAVPQ